MHSAANTPLDDGAVEKLTSLNPAPWSQRRGHDLGQLRTGAHTILTIGGQRPVDADGRLLHEGDLAAQLALALHNLTDVVLQAGMELVDLAHLRVYTTDMPALVEVEFVVAEHLAGHGATTPITTVEVGRLALPGMAVEIDALAVCSTPCAAVIAG